MTCFSRPWQDRVPPEPRQPGDLPEGLWPYRALLRGGRWGQQSSPSGGPGQPAVPFPPAGGPHGGLPAISQHPLFFKIHHLPPPYPPISWRALRCLTHPSMLFSPNLPPPPLPSPQTHTHQPRGGKLKLSHSPAPLLFILLSQWTDFL